MMNVTCPHCRKPLSVDASRLEAGRSHQLSCPSCQGQLQVTAPEAAAGGTARPPDGPSANDAPSEQLVSTVVARVLQVLAAGGQLPAAPETARPADASACDVLLVSADAAWSDRVASHGAEWTVTRVVDATGCAAWLERERGSVLLIDEMAGAAAEQVSAWVARLPLARRRQVFVVRASPTPEPGRALSTGADFIVGRDDPAGLVQAVKQAAARHRELYRPFLEALEVASA